VAQPFSNHNGGQIVFGPDGMLYIGLGDGGSGNDPENNGQNLGTLLGSLLRIDVSGDAHSIPPDNPFVGRQGARAEIWAYGLRNPWRFSFDSVTGDLWLADVGQNTREEVNVITRGGNYGWRIMEGAECRGGGTNCDMSGLQPPIIDYATAGGNCSVTGGFVYRGSAIGALQGAYVYADYCSGRIWALRTEGFVRSDHRQIGDAPFRISSFAQDGNGDLYVLEHANAGGIYKLVE
jgi:glucose/arabinose dehydrogenase